MRLMIAFPVVVLAGCTSPSLQGIFMPPTDSAAGADSDTVRPQARPATLDTTPPPPPPRTARTVEQFDTTTKEDRDAAVAVSQPAGGRSLGKTIAALGSPTDPGIWLKTPLVTELTKGRVDYNGKSINIELRPSGGAAGSGSQLSLAAMRLLGAPLTGLPEISVFAN